MFKKISDFSHSEDGAVTVDWVVITAAVVGLAGLAIVAISGSTGNVGDGIGTWLTAYLPGASS
ncbi:hypothetical protein HKX54_00775 [Sulfitobacter sp. M57]|uniref:hypothetical protein n=1 Tax=unclassified Sulfitobacter TaxID=196795 RepID=UPI0023E33C33|nr:MULTISPECIES: hypothetical protein [unclassified Sulfitobacter]MDF3412977.1 hypothetical protein [Sulfitobacter sp. KE5]MDF3421739.1 hypothetical protein [Sulfitobacter sp. KE43]MDF3431526.1 hypothetical protein [Sulfitobacter sp. KE42]MDF3457167.1 hypothetical protein [Sulfitobacter sp. S74]MDF3461070.1 hypothetical protein [Sulfitobacter sp. Ks18]